MIIGYILFTLEHTTRLYFLSNLLLDQLLNTHYYWKEKNIEAWMKKIKIGGMWPISRFLQLIWIASLEDSYAINFFALIVSEKP